MNNVFFELHSLFVIQLSSTTATNIMIKLFYLLGFLLNPLSNAVSVQVTKNGETMIINPIRDQFIKINDASSFIRAVQLSGTCQGYGEQLRAPSLMLANGFRMFCEQDFRLVTQMITISELPRIFKTKNYERDLYFSPVPQNVSKKNALFTLSSTIEQSRCT